MSIIKTIVELVNIKGLDIDDYQTGEMYINLISVIDLSIILNDQIARL